VAKPEDDPAPSDPAKPAILPADPQPWDVKIDPLSGLPFLAHQSPNNPKPEWVEMLDPMSGLAIARRVREDEAELKELRRQLAAAQEHRGGQAITPATPAIDGKSVAGVPAEDAVESERSNIQTSGSGEAPVKDPNPPKTEKRQPSNRTNPLREKVISRPRRAYRKGLHHGPGDLVRYANDVVIPVERRRYLEENKREAPSVDPRTLQRWAAEARKPPPQK
jgi:hypothetical protein